MPTSANFGWTTPVAGDDPDVPTDMQVLATGIDTTLFSKMGASKITRGAWDISTDGGGNAVFAHGLGAVPVSVQANLSAGNTTGVNQVGVLVWSGADSTNATISVVRSDTGAALAGTIHFTWIAMT